MSTLKGSVRWFSLRFKSQIEEKKLTTNQSFR